MQLEEYKTQILPLKNQLYRVAYQVLGSPDEARDVVQEVLIKVWNKRRELGVVDNLNAYLNRMTKNLAIDKTRSKHRRTIELDTAYGFMADAPDPLAKTETSDTFNHIRELMSGLPDKQNLVMTLRDFDGLTYQEIVNQTGLSMSQVKVYLARARGKMRELLRENKN